MITIDQKASFFANQPIIEPDLSIYPCIVQDCVGGGVSDRYKQVRTIDVVSHMRERGYKVTAVNASRNTSQGGNFGRHIIRMRQEFHARPVEDCLPELILGNSHDGSSRCVIMLGLWRAACANGLISGSKGHFSYELTHVGDIKDQVFNIIEESTGRIVELTDAVKQWGDRILSHHERVEFAEKAKLLRWGESDRKVDALGLSPLQVLRREDDGNSLWQVFNRVQENLTKGGLSYRSDNHRGLRNSRRLHTKPLSAPSKVLGFNRALWDLAASYAN